MSTNDGGPAFPHDGQQNYTGGMTLRDYFAAQAMQPIVLAAMQVAGPESSVDFAAISEAAYRMADAMLKAREAAWYDAADEIEQLKRAAVVALDALETHAKQYPHMQKGYTIDAIGSLRAVLTNGGSDER